MVEAIAGWWAHSLALLSDAGHMLSDAFALWLAACAERVAHRRRAGEDLHRAEMAAAVINSLLMAAIVLWIAFEAFERLRAPRPVDGAVVAGIALVGVGVNVLVAKVISHGEQTLNTRAALLHVFGDLAGSVVALISGVVIYLTGWLPIDPILSLVVAGLIGFATFNLLREAWTTARANRS